MHALLRAQMLPPPYTKVSHTCVPRNCCTSDFRKEKSKENIFVRGTNSISFKGIFLKENPFTSWANAMHCCMQVGLSKGEERRRGSSAALLRFSLPPAFPPYQKTSYYYYTQQPLKSTHFLHNLYASPPLASGERRRGRFHYTTTTNTTTVLQRPPTLSRTHAYTVGMACFEGQFQKLSIVLCRRSVSSSCFNGAKKNDCIKKL